MKITKKKLDRTVSIERILTEKDKKLLEKIKLIRKQKFRKKMDILSESLRPVLGLIGMIIIGLIFLLAEIGLLLLAVVMNFSVEITIFLFLSMFMICVCLWHDAFIQYMYRRKK